MTISSRRHTAPKSTPSSLISWFTLFLNFFLVGYSYMAICFNEIRKRGKHYFGWENFLCLVFFSVSYISLSVSTLFKFLMSCDSCPGLIVVVLSLVIMFSFVPADQIPIRTKQISHFHLALMLFTCLQLLFFSQAGILHYLGEREAMLFLSFPSDVDIPFRNQSRFNQGSVLCKRSGHNVLSSSESAGGNCKHRQ